MAFFDLNSKKAINLEKGNEVKLVIIPVTLPKGSSSTCDGGGFSWESPCLHSHLGILADK